MTTGPVAAAAAVPAGFDPGFLGVGVPLPTPGPALAAVGLVKLAYVHFTVLLHPVRRLAAVTAVNIDGAALVELDRADDWRLDARVPASQQVGEELYARNDLDRGHLVRRRDPVWGPLEVARQANDDTFMFTNAAPQAAVFNQSKQLWNGLEDYVLEHARTYRRRLSVLTGPVLADDDPIYRGVQLPRRFYKIAAWAHQEDPDAGLGLAASGYLLDQTPQLDDLDLSGRQVREETGPPPLGPFRTFQVPIDDLAALTGLVLGPLPAADRLRGRPTATPGSAATGQGSSSWVRLEDLGDIAL